MPTLPPRPCRHAGCPALVADGTGFCQLHQSDRCATRRTYDEGTRRNDPALAEAARIRSTARWQKLRALHRAQNPLCADPFGDHVRAGGVELNEQSHHIKPLATHPELAFDLANLMPVCARCHAKIENTKVTHG